MIATSGMRVTTEEAFRRHRRKSIKISAKDKRKVKRKEMLSSSSLRWLTNSKLRKKLQLMLKDLPNTTKNRIKFYRLSSVDRVK